MKKAGKIVLHTIVFIVLTLITQIGGVVYLMSFVFCKRIKKAFPLKGLVVFILIYSLGTFVTVPVLAKLFNRERVEHYPNLKPANYMTVLFNRNYVSKEMNTYLKDVSEDLAKRDDKIVMRYLDACLPLIDGFPLLPHLSHNDGKKIDFSLVYENGEGEIINASKSISGYGVFEAPRKGELNQTRACLKSGFWQYNYPQYLTLGSINDKLHFSEKGTKDLMDALLNHSAIEKAFLEPHLKQRLKLSSNKVRFQGCRSVRHDDHIHVQIR